MKLAPLDPVHREMIGASGMGEREAQFYADVAPSVDLRVPPLYYAASADDGSFALLLEDLAGGGCEFSDGAWGVTADAAAGALEELARFHARFEDPGRALRVAPWLATPQPATGDMAAQLCALGPRRSTATCSRRPTSAVGELYVEHHARLDELWNAGPQTYIHGDTHIGNVFLDRGRVGFVDWGLSRVSTPLRDVSYFLTMSVDPEERRRSERDLLRLYLDALRSAGGADIAFDEAWLVHRVQAAYTVVATFLVFMPSYGTPEAQVLGAALRTALGDGAGGPRSRRRHAGRARRVKRRHPTARRHPGDTSWTTPNVVLLICPMPGRPTGELRGGLRRLGSATRE